MSLTTPLTRDGGFYGIAGVDIRMAELEPKLMAIIDRAPSDAVLINAERAVLAANTPRWVAGSRLASTPEVGGAYGDSTSGGTSPAMACRKICFPTPSLILRSAGNAIANSTSG